MPFTDTGTKENPAPKDLRLKLVLRWGKYVHISTKKMQQKRTRPGID